MTRTRILVIDDQVGIRALFREICRAFDFEMIEASDGAEGLRLAQKQEVDVIFLDMKMPGLSGVECLRLLRERARLDAPVVLVTAYQEAEAVGEAERLGVAATLMKPFDIEDLRQLILRLRRQ